MRSKAWMLRNMTVVVGATLVALSAGVAVAAETESSIARGGRLYDKWWAEKETEKPTTEHPAYPNKGGKYSGDSWRCKECHGWDYKGKDGAYGSGAHQTGIKGIAGAAGKDPAAIALILRDSTHGYSEQQLDATDIRDLSLFVAKGQIDVSAFVAAPTNKPTGTAEKGEVYYNTICAGCHGFDGKKEKKAVLGEVAGNRPEMLHKTFNGHPGQSMPALRALPAEITVDIVTYLPSLPKK